MTKRAFVIALSLSLLLSAGAVAADWQTGTYVYDGGGNIKSIGATEQFRYDAFGRLVNGTAGPGHTQILTYDAFGNIRTMTTDGTQMRLGVETNTNRLTLQSVDGQPANIFGTYDAAGRLTSELGGVGNAFAYDATNMITRTTIDGVERVLLYTASDERIASVTVSNGTSVHSEWTLRDPGNRVLQFLELNGTQWTWREDYIHQGAQLIAAELSASSGTLHFFVDHLGSTRLTTGNGGVKTAFRTYYPFGNDSTSEQDTERRRFTGHERDSDSLYYMHARYYNPKWARFLSVDPAGRYKPTVRPQAWNRYSYAQNSPIVRFDPDGLRDIYVAFWNKHFPYLGSNGSVGHVGAFELNGRVLLSQFPQPQAKHGKNITRNYAETVTFEGRSPDKVFRVFVPDDKGFDAAVRSLVFPQTKSWDWSPDAGASETNCVAAVITALKAGGIDLQSFGLVLPEHLQEWMEEQASDKPDPSQKWSITAVEEFFDAATTSSADDILGRILNNQWLFENSFGTYVVVTRR